MMQKDIIERLNGINRDFYNTIATDFDQTRGQAWHGWEKALAHLQPIANVAQSVLDVGCGNGRFGAFMRQNFAGNIAYHGMDNNAPLLDFAQKSLADLPEMRVTLEQRDIVQNPPNAGEYSCVGLFGVIHHIPSRENRLAFLAQLAERVAQGGVLIFASWCFYESERLRERIVAWEGEFAELAPHVETNDYLLDWRRGARAVRYCHYVDEPEHDDLIRATGLQELVRYYADGDNGRMNRYSILKRL